MNKSKILQIIALMILALGAFMLFQHFTNENESSSPLGGIGAMIGGIAILILSRNKAITKK